jgi:predicted HAD superfamily Cof-like phosphohydrolase
VPQDRVELRLSLITEELVELAVASGRLGTIRNLLANQLGLFPKDALRELFAKDDTFTADIVECADAFGDLNYVLDGGKIEYGLHTVMDAVSDDIHGSNMSKLCENLEVAHETVAHYAASGVDAYFLAVGDGLYGVYRKEDNKILKSVNYRPTNLTPLVLGHGK